jgi:hypothetical protein
MLYRGLHGENHVGLRWDVIRNTVDLVPGVEDMTNWGGDYRNGQAVLGVGVDNGAIDNLERFSSVSVPRRPTTGVWIQIGRDDGVPYLCKPVVAVVGFDELGQIPAALSDAS